MAHQFGDLYDVHTCVGKTRPKCVTHEPLFWETHFKGPTPPTVGQVPSFRARRLVEMTWDSGAEGTNGAETVVTVELTPRESGAHFKLTHAGFSYEESKNRHEQVWPDALKQLDLRMTTAG